MAIRIGQSPHEILGKTVVEELLEPLQGRLSEVQRRTLRSLAKEGDPELLAEGLLNLARQAESGDNLEVAATIYRSLESESISNFREVRARAHRSLQAMEGKGELGARTEHLLGRFVKEATDPAMIFAMGTAGAMYRATRLATLVRLAANPSTSLLSRGLAARTAASLVGFSVEATAFPILGRMGGEALGRSRPWTAKVLGQEVASSFLVLGALKFCGHATASLYRRGQGFTGGIFPELGERVTRQAGMLSGILLGHGLERELGLASSHAGSDNLVDSLALLLQFNIAGRLSREAFGTRFAAWERTADWKFGKLSTQTLDSLTSRAGWLPLQGAHALASIKATSRGVSDYLVKMEARADAVTSAQAPSLPPPDFKYPPELEAAWHRVESAWNNPNYYEGSREELAAKRPNPDDIDAIWFHQAMDYARRLGAEVEVLDIAALREQVTETGKPHIDPELFARTMTLLGERGREGSVARRVLRVSFTSQALGSIDMRNPQMRYLGLPPTVQDLEEFVSGKIRLMEDLRDSDGVKADFPSLSFTEALFHTSSGRPGTQFHFVSGAIPRDKVMSLRARRVSPLGLSRGLEFLGDLGFEIHPFSFAGHDGFFHAARDAEQADPFPQVGGWLYEALNRELPVGALREKLLDNLADSNLGGAQAGWNEFTSAVTNPLRLALMDAQTHRESERIRRDLKGALGIFRQILTEADPMPSVLSGEAQRFLAGLDRLSRRLNRVEQIAEEYRAQGSEVSPPRYDPETLDAMERIEARFQNPHYLQGNRDELRKKRVNIEDADKLWYAQARNLDRHIPDADAYLSDARILFQEAAGRSDLNQDLTLLEAALERLDSKSMSAEAGQVLVLEVPIYFMASNSLHSPSNANFLRFDSFMLDLEMRLDNRVQLIELDGAKRRYRIPSLALTESLLEAARGEHPSQLHFVPGEISPYDTRRLGEMGVLPVSLDFNPKPKSGS